MTYDTFLEQVKNDLESRFATQLPDQYRAVKIDIRDVAKIQGESYRGISFRNRDSPVQGNLNMNPAYAAYQAGKSYADILQETEQAIMHQLDRMPQFDLALLANL